MRIDHIAYRVRNRFETAEFIMKCFGYRLAEDLPEGFQIKFEDDSVADCLVLLPKEQVTGTMPWMTELYFGGEFSTYHMAPEIFISDGTADSIVGKWVMERNGVGGIHHIAYQVDDVEKTMLEWQQKGYAEFATKDPLKCPGLVQVFTKPSVLTGVIYEFITREDHGFCKDNVKLLMESTKGFK
jgi:catechol 2,3-dioxygenase-like lactoylglutathione lyase family enzyme